MPTTTPAIDAARVSDIARQIRGATTPLFATTSGKQDAKDLLTDASQADTALREKIMVAVASLSQVGQWTIPEINAAAAKAAAMSADTKADKAVATFIGETKRAMNPKVRAFVPDLIELRDTTWQSETEQRAMDKDAPTPLRKAFVRQYHMMVQMFGLAET